MKNKLLHIILLLVLLGSFSKANAQNKELTGYRIEGDEIVFSFDKRDYKKGSDEGFFGKTIEFKDFDIYSVVVSGEFNNWSKDKWKMTKIDENIYELRKKIDDFSDDFTWEFKYVVNNTYWAEPSKNDINISNAKKDGYPLFVYNLKLFTTTINKNGNATFKLEGFQDAKEVVLAGSFNKWDEKVFTMNKKNDHWELTLQLKPGIHEYKFIVDGTWIHDPNNNLSRGNEHGSLNSIKEIKKNIVFKLRGFENATRVILAGTFNDWSEDKFIMSKSNDGWIYHIDLPGGKHSYKFIVDQKWMLDPDNPVKEYDENGHINSVIIIK